MKIRFVLVCFLFLLFLCSCGNPKTTCSSTDYFGENYETVVSELQKLGFQNIVLEEIQDLTSKSDLQDGDIGEISINGVSDFLEETEFDPESVVLIKYHTIKKLEYPISDEDFQINDSVSIAALFESTGFENVSFEDVYDLDPDIYDVDVKYEVKVDGYYSVAKGDMIPFDKEIKIVSHRPYEKYSVKINVDFVSNLLLNKYDVFLSLNGEKHLMEHGQDSTFDFRLKKGKYTLLFINDDSSDIRGEVELDVFCDVDASYKINCNSDSVSVNTIYVDNLTKLAEHEVKTLFDKYGFTNENYKDVVLILQEWGFTNIKEIPLYDIYWGWTEEESVETVTINGSDDYKKGDVFNRDAVVIVEYHLSYLDDPSRPVEDDSSYSDVVQESYLTINNCPDLAEILSIKSDFDDKYISFASEYAGKIVEFDGRIDYIALHGDYKTRYDILVSAGDYDPDRQIGPSFKFKDVGAYDLGLSSLDDVPSKLPVGSNVKIVAEIVSFNTNSYLFFLDPILVELR